MSVSWSNGWREVTDEKHRLYIERELCWELEQVREHPLRGIQYRVAAGCNLYDDFILLLQEDGSYGYVPLMCKPESPPFKRLGNHEDLLQFIRQWKVD